MKVSMGRKRPVPVLDPLAPPVVDETTMSAEAFEAIVKKKEEENLGVPVQPVTDNELENFVDWLASAEVAPERKEEEGVVTPTEEKKRKKKMEKKLKTSEKGSATPKQGKKKVEEVTKKMEKKTVEGDAPDAKKCKGVQPECQGGFQPYTPVDQAPPFFNVRGVSLCWSCQRYLDESKPVKLANGRYIIVIDLCPRCVDVNEKIVKLKKGDY